MTPEGRVKRQIDNCLACWANVYKIKPVLNGMGAPALDYFVSVAGRFLAIEAKAPKGRMTERQENTAAEIRAAGGTVLVIDGDLTELLAYLNMYTERKYTLTPEAGRRAKLKSKYGITPEQYDTMLHAQGGHCFFCARRPAQEFQGILCVDHCHETKRVRGLVCRRHNYALWQFGDNIVGFERALAYVKGGNELHHLAEAPSNRSPRDRGGSHDVSKGTTDRGR